MMIKKLIISSFLLSSSITSAASYDDCILSKMAGADNDAQAQTIRATCEAKVEAAKEEGVTSGAITKRFLAEKQTQWNRHSITAHKQNYILPYTHSNKINRQPYVFQSDWADELKHYEAKFQLSVKVPLTTNPFFTETGGLYVGFTLQSWWQLYADKISAPFRETNYQPEIFYLTATNWHPFGGSTGVTIGMEHQSNGRSQLLSRSWNRVYTSFMFEKDNFALSLRPWYRIKEDEKENPNESDGDDNPDIEKFMGHFELRSAYRWNDHEFSLMGRNNLRSDNFGAVELGWSFPLTGHLKGFVQYFNGYGESLIDYNHNTERVGVGILLTDLL
jgi:phospholipase A1